MAAKLLVYNLTPALSEAFQTLCFKKGIQWNSGSTDFLYPERDALGVWGAEKGEGRLLTALGKDDEAAVKLDAQTEFPKIAEYLFGPKFAPITIRLNTEHSAVVSIDGVQVGCQRFTFKAIEDLYTVVQQAKEKAAAKK